LRIMKESSASDGILVNALQASHNAAGVGRYALEVARGLCRRREDVHVVTRTEMADAFDLSRERLSLANVGESSWRRILFEQFSLPSLAENCRLIHFPDSASILRGGMPCLMTVHDLSFFTCEGTFTWSQTLWKKQAARLSARHALRVICSSRHTATDVASFLRVPEERIRVVYPGVTTHAGEAAPPGVSCPDEPFILAVGTLEPRKNFVRLMRSVARLHRQGPKLPLVIAGKPGWIYQDILRAPRDLGIEDAVTFAGYCSDPQLKWLYQRARMLAYVSLYEGFGFPPLEAMSYGLPVVAANVSSMPEVCEEAAIYAAPESVVEITDAIRRLHSDESLRDHLVARGREQAARFTWARTAEDLSGVFDELEVP